MGKMQRTKGARGQSEFKKMLLDRDWIVDTLTVGIKSGDLIAESSFGDRYNVEVKYHELINMRLFLSQAKEQAKKRKLLWMLAIRIPQFPGQWLVCRENFFPTIWRRKDNV